MTPVDSIMNKNIYKTRGGANNFIKSLEQDIFPHIAKNFRSNSKRLLMGHSYSGLFVVHAFSTRPDLFDKYLAFSPILWWNNKAIVRDVEKFLTENSSIRKHLFISFAEEAEEMLKSCKALILALETKSPADLKWHYGWMPDQSHYTLYRKSLMQGMEIIFTDYKYPDEQLLIDKGVEVANNYTRDIALLFVRKCLC
jgi:predicted alpha/beta superfamily hydrolase